MKYDEIIKLLDAGYSREEIMKMDEPDPKPADDPKPVDETKPEDVLKGFADEVKAAIKDLTKEITAANIMASRQQPEPDNEDLLANIINPKIDKNGGK